MSGKRISRREMLRGLGIAVVGGALASCTPQVVKETVVVEKVVEKVVKETVIVEGTPQIVEKIVKETVVVQAPKEPIELVFMHSHKAYPPWAEETIDPWFEDEHPGITIKREFTAGRGPVLYPKLIAMHAGGIPWDILHVMASGQGEYTLVVKGLLKDLDPFVNAEGYDLSVYFPSLLDLARKVGGVLYMLPTYIDGGNACLWYNKDLFDKAGLPYPTSEWAYTDDFKSVLVELEKALNPPGTVDRIGTWFPEFRWWMGPQTIISAWGGSFVDDEGRKVTLGEPEAKGALQFINSLYDEGIVQRVLPEGGATPAMRAGRVAMETQWLSNLVNMYASAKETGFEAGSCMMPKGPGGRHGGYLNRQFIGMHSDTKHAEAAWEYIKFFNSEETAEARWLGLGKPTARIADWENERFTDVFPKPVFGEAVEVLSSRDASAGLYTWNFRDSEVADTFIHGMAPVWLGELDFEQGLDDTIQAMQNVLDQPMMI